MDIQFLLNDIKVNVRVSGIRIHEGKVLLHQVEGDIFWGAIGGKIKAG